MASVARALSTLSTAERDRRYTALRARFAERGVDGAIVWGTNLFYLSNGLPGEQLGLLTTNDNPLDVWVHRRHLGDVGPEVFIEAQEWVSRVAVATIDAIAARLRELGLERGTIGLTDTENLYGGVSLGLNTALRAALPELKLVDVTDIFDDTRTVKSAEEVALIERANIAFDRAVERMAHVGRPGMTGQQLLQEGIRAAWEAGGDLASEMSACIGPVPKQSPIYSYLSLHRPIQNGDIATITAHTEYAHYCGHSDQEIAFGTPSELHLAMFEAVKQVRTHVLSVVKPGCAYADLERAYEEAARDTGFQTSPHTQMHQYGIDVPEFPGPKFALPGRRNYQLVPGMIFSISPTLVAPNGEDTMLGGTSLVITESGYRELGDRPVELYRAQG